MSVTEQFKEFVDSLDQKSLQREYVIGLSAQLLFEVMKEKGLSNADLARKLGKSRPYVTQILRGTRNIGLGTLSDILYTLGKRVKLDVEDLTNKNVYTYMDDALFHFDELKPIFIDTTRQPQLGVNYEYEQLAS